LVVESKSAVASIGRPATRDAVGINSCISPYAAATETAVRSKRLSWRMTASTT